MISADLKPEVCSTLASRKSGAASLMSPMISGSRDAHDAAESRALDLEDDLRPRAGAALVLLHPRGVGLELPAVLRQQRQADAVARNEPRNARRQRLERQRHVDRARDDVEHRVLRLQLFDFVQRGAMGVFLGGEAIGEGADPAGRRGWPTPASRSSRRRFAPRPMLAATRRRPSAQVAICMTATVATSPQIGPAPARDRSARLLSSTYHLRSREDLPNLLEPAPQAGWPERRTLGNVYRSVPCMLRAAGSCSAQIIPSVP